MANTISAKELASKIINQKETQILDVRNEDEFTNWKIEGNSVHIINEPYFNLLDGIGPLTDKLDQNQDIIVVCAKGGSSEMVVDLLHDAGYTGVYSLEGGMKAWGEYLEPVKIGDLQDGGSLYQFVRLGKGCLSYMIESNGEAAVVDASRMIDVYETFANDHNVQINHVIDTHLHADHISGGRALAESADGTYYLPPKDATEVTFDYKPLEEGSTITVGNTTVHVQPIYSPGHTIGSTSLIIDDTYLLTGDILFVKSIGRPDLAGMAGEWADDLHDTLYSRYKKLSAELTVLPAHYSFAEELGKGGKVSARLGDLYQKNAGLQVENKDEFRKMVTENLPPQPNDYDKIRQTNMGQINPDPEEKKEMESGPNRCAIEG